MFAISAEFAIQYDVDIPRLLSGEVGGDHYRQAYRRCLGDAARSCLCYQYIRHDHVLCHLIYESQWYHSDISQYVHIVDIIHGYATCRSMDGMLHSRRL